MYPGKAPLVSVIVITYNSSKYVIETLDSIFDQSYKHIELIVSDDRSTDDTVMVCESWISSHRDRFENVKVIVADKNGGIAQNCNRGWKVSTGEWVKFIAGDDALCPDIISSYISFSQGQKNVTAVFSRVLAYKELLYSEHIVKVKTHLSSRFNSLACTPQEQFKILLRHNCVNAPSVMLKKGVLEKLGGFDEQFPFLEDWPMWLALTKAGYKMHFVDIVGAKYRIHVKSVQQNDSRKIYKSQVDFAVDRMYERYIGNLPFFEKCARATIIYRNRYISKLSGNKSNIVVAFFSKLIGVVPFFIIERNKRRFFNNV